MTTEQVLALSKQASDIEQEIKQLNIDIDSYTLQWIIDFIVNKIETVGFGSLTKINLHNKLYTKLNWTI